jgi:hypothetical protein
MANLLGTTVDGSLLIGPSGAAHAYSGAATGKLYFGNQVSDSPTHYHITTNIENYNGNYSKLDIRWYTGQRFYAHTGYGGFRFYEITTNADLFSVGKGDAHVRVENNLYVGNTIYNNGNAVIHAGNIGSQSVSYATTAGSVSGGLTTSNYASTLDGRYFFDFGFTIGYPGTDANNMPGNRSAFTYSNGAPYTGPIAHFGAAGYGLQLNANYGTGTLLGFRVRNGDNGTWNAWREIIHSGNIASQSVSYATTSGTSSATTQTDFSELSVGGEGVATREYVTSQGYLTSLPSHNHDDRYFTEAESDGRFFFAQSSQLANTNLNDLTTRGVYYSGDQYGTNTNIPFANYFTMINLTNEASRQAQLWFGDTPGNAYWRPRQGGSTWHPWEKLITSNNIGDQSVSYATSAGSATTATNLGADYTADDWFRATADNNPVKFYGNSYQMTWRTDGADEAYSGIGGYPFVWTYGGSSTGNRRMLMDTSGNLWTNTYGWLHDYFQIASTAITTSNIGSQSVSYATSAGDAATVGGKTATNNANNLAVYESNGYLYIPSWMNVNGGGIFSSTNNAHLRPNTSSYGAWEMIGSRNGWSGIFFNDSNNTLMANADESGFYKIGDGWQFRWYRGEMYISPGTYGGGAERTVIHSGNIGSQSVSYASSAGNADTLDGYHSNTVGNRHHTARGFTVGGDQNIYYPVTFGGSGAYAFNRYSIYRYYQWTAPWDPLGTGYHRGGLTFDFEWSGDIAWGGNDHTLRVIQLSEQYTSQVGGLALPVTQGVCVWLRGGTSYYEIQVDAYPVDVVVHLEGFTAGNGVFYGPREDNSNIQSEIYNRMPVRGSSELYDGGSRVITAGNIASQSVSYAVTSGTSSATTQTNFSELFIGDAPVATKEYVTSQGYITGYTETDTLQSATDRGASTSAQVSFTKTDDHAISVGTIRGRAVGSQGGEFIQLYERVNIGGPNGWGAANTSAPTYGLSVFGGASIGYGNSGGLTVTGQSNLNGQVYINRHIDANTGWGNASGNTIFVGWNGGKVVLGNSNSGGHDYARDITEQSIVSTNQHYFYTTANFNSNVNINGGIKQNNIVGRPYAVWGAGGSSTGAVVIKFPGNADNYGMVHAVVDIYEYNGNNVCTIIIGGHNWGSRWYSYGANMVGFTDKPVRLAFKDGQYAIVIGNDSSSWSYGQVVLRKIQNGSYYAGAMDVASGYTVGIEPESSTWISEDLRGLRVGGPVSATNISTGVTANHIVQRDANGYIYANHINFSTPESENPTINSFITSNGDGWSRKSSLAHVRNQLGNYGSWITTDGRAYPRRADGSDMNFYWDGQGGQPTWLWGSSDGQNMYVWNPSNFSVNYATTSGTSSATTQTDFSELSVGGEGVATREYVTSQGYLTSLPSHNHDDRYYTESESDGRYVQYGSITGSFGLSDNKLYLRTNGDNNHYLWNAADDWEEMVYYSGTGFRVKGSTGTVPAYFTEAGVYASAYRGKDNVGGTGTASWHPDGIYVGSTQWLYGTQYRNGSTTSGQGWMYLDYDYGHSIVGLYSSTRYQGVWAMGDSYKLPANGASTGSLYGMAWSHPNAGGVAGNLNTHGLLVMENGTFLAAISGSIRARDDMRAPIFYDSEDTEYYLDPNGQSYLNKLTLAGSTHFYPNNWIEFGGHYGLYSGTNNAHFYPNNASYGSWRVAGSRNGWHGIHFDSGATLMMNSNESGVHREGYGWQWRWENGTMYCHKNSYGGGTQATVLDSSNWSNFISVPQGLVTGNTSSAEINTSKFNIYNNNLTEQAVVLQMNTTDILVYDRMQGLSRLRGGIEGVVELMIDQSGFYFWTTEQLWQPIFCEYVDQVSDIKLKHHIRTIPSALDKVKQLRGVEFLWKKNNQPSIGFIAQEVEEVLPVAVGNANDTKTIDYSKIIPVLTEAIKEQQTLIEQLMARLEALETR